VVIATLELSGLTDRSSIVKVLRSYKGRTFILGSAQSDDGSPISYPCLWLDCGCAFTEQVALVQHIERRHVESTSSSSLHGGSRRLHRDRERDKDKEKEKEGKPKEFGLGQDDFQFACLWQGCSRDRPFNARYKLLIHMRVHSGEKPNKCPVSRLPNRHAPPRPLPQAPNSPARAATYRYEAPHSSPAARRPSPGWRTSRSTRGHTQVSGPTRVSIAGAPRPSATAAIAPSTRGPITTR
jgi:hypothetical protein